jgi:hypothetical protein
LLTSNDASDWNFIPVLPNFFLQKYLRAFFFCRTDQGCTGNILCSVGTSTVGQGQIQKLVPVLQLKRIFQLYLLIYAIFNPLQASIVFQSKTILDSGSRRKWTDLKYVFAMKINKASRHQA